MPVINNAHNTMIDTYEFIYPNVNINIKRVTSTATLPTKAHSTDACFDIYVDEPDKNLVNGTEKGFWKLINNFRRKFKKNEDFIYVYPHSQVTLHTGFCTAIPEGYWCPVFARSGLGIKHNLRPSNCVGVIDSAYRGEWMVALYNDSNKVRKIKHGDRVAQFAILPVIRTNLIEVEELDETDRGNGGFGSTGE